MSTKTHVDRDSEVFEAIRLKKPKTETLAIRVDAQFAERLAKLAEARGLTPSTLARMWLLEKIGQESPL